MHYSVQKSATGRLSSSVPNLLLIDTSVNVTRESEYRKRLGRFRACFGYHPEPTNISIDQLYGVLAHGAPGEYVLVGY